MKDIKGYEGLYAVTEDGKVWSYKSKKFLAQTANQGGYLKVCLYKDGKIKGYFVHRLVGETYISNPLGLPCINHRNEIKTDNRVENLEFCDHKYNNNYGKHNEKVALAKSKPVVCVETGQVYQSALAAAAELGIDNSGIGKACKGIFQTCGKLHWRYAETDNATSCES